MHKTVTKMLRLVQVVTGRGREGKSVMEDLSVKKIREGCAVMARSPPVENMSSHPALLVTIPVSSGVDFIKYRKSMEYLFQR